MPLLVDEIEPEIGARVRAAKADLVSGRHADELLELMENRGVLVFPEADFDEDELLAFSRTLGRIAFDHDDERSTTISIDPAHGAVADYTRASFFWHFDGYMHDAPVRASIMCPRVLSDEGGDTEFCNTYAAWEALPDDRKAQIEGLRAVHALAGAQLAIEPEPSFERFAEWQEIPHRTLPLVWTHDSGRKSLVIGNTAVGVCDLDPLEGLELLVWLRDWATQDRFSYTHRWSMGDAVMWDNTGTLHRVTPYSTDSGRVMVRTKLEGRETIS